jgi:hypothetical protein
MLFLFIVLSVPAFLTIPGFYQFSRVKSKIRIVVKYGKDASGASFDAGIT